MQRRPRKTFCRTRTVSLVDERHRGVDGGEEQREEPDGGIHLPRGYTADEEEDECWEEGCQAEDAQGVGDGGGEDAEEGRGG